MIARHIERIGYVVAALIVWGCIPNVVHAQTVTLRPQRSFDVSAGFLNPDNARDTNTFTGGGGTVSRICHTHCTSVTSLTASWDQFSNDPNYDPDHEAVQLEVQWRSTSSILIFGNSTTQITGTVEYDLGSGWQILESHTWNTQNSGTCPVPSNQSILCFDHVTTLPLSAGQDQTVIRVRATVTVQFTQCHNCTLNTSNLTGLITVYDVRLITDSTAPRTSRSAMSAAAHTFDLARNREYSVRSVDYTRFMFQSLPAVWRDERHIAF